ncbi:hypothetical protein TcG_06084 [Trypanosoma cruzi]|nr:hypothetical protein TcG_06084 [Trypanosoma cruzi]
MPSTHREPTANATRGKWGHNQRTLQWLHEQTIRMRFESSRNNFILKNDPVRRGYNVTSHSQFSFNKFIAWYLSEIQRFQVSSRSLVDTSMRMVAYKFLQTTMYTCDAPCALRGTSLTTTWIKFALSAQNTSSRNQ